MIILWIEWIYMYNIFLRNITGNEVLYIETGFATRNTEATSLVRASSDTRHGHNQTTTKPLWSLPVARLSTSPLKKKRRMLKANAWPQLSTSSPAPNWSLKQNDQERHNCMERAKTSTFVVSETSRHSNYYICSVWELTTLKLLLPVSA